MNKFSLLFLLAFLLIGLFYLRGTGVGLVRTIVTGWGVYTILYGFGIFPFLVQFLL